MFSFKNSIIFTKTYIGLSTNCVIVCATRGYTSMQQIFGGVRLYVAL